MLALFVFSLTIGLIIGFRLGVWAAPSVLVQRILSKKNQPSKKG